MNNERGFIHILGAALFTGTLGVYCLYTAFPELEKWWYGQDCTETTGVVTRSYFQRGRFRDGSGTWITQRWGTVEIEFSYLVDGQTHTGSNYFRGNRYGSEKLARPELEQYAPENSVELCYRARVPTQAWIKGTELPISGIIAEAIVSLLGVIFLSVAVIGTPKWYFEERAYQRARISSEDNV